MKNKPYRALEQTSKQTNDIIKSTPKSRETIPLILDTKKIYIRPYCSQTMNVGSSYTKRRRGGGGDITETLIKNQPG
jgi:hypothetical protein